MAQSTQVQHVPIIEIDQSLLTASAEYAKISELLPHYDGNKKTLNFFIKAVENVLDIVSNKDKDPSIGSLIVKKLQGRAVEVLAEVLKPGPKLKPHSKIDSAKHVTKLR